MCELEARVPSVNYEEILDAIRDESLQKLGYFLKPEKLFSVIAAKGNSDKADEDNYIFLY